ncbi:MAG: HAD hydrolase-like protein [Candidatus Aenigmarchaeota archaeon]|nr:HAD hydrolase-like protein [Candidatus Aenigmarchaeota archaeon]
MIRAVLFDLEGPIASITEDKLALGLAEKQAAFLAEMELQTDPKRLYRETLDILQDIELKSAKDDPKANTVLFFWQSLLRKHYAVREEKIALAMAKKTIDAVIAISRPHSDVLPALKLLRDSGVKLAVIDPMEKEYISSYLAAHRLDKFFDVSVSGSEVTLVYPAPDLLAHAANLLGIPAGQCLTVSNKPECLEGARKAGMATCWVERGRNEFLRGKADFQHKNLERLAELVKAE